MELFINFAFSMFALISISSITGSADSLDGGTAGGVVSSAGCGGSAWMNGGTGGNCGDGMSLGVFEDLDGGGAIGPVGNDGAAGGVGVDDSACECSGITKL